MTDLGDGGSVRAGQREVGLHGSGPLNKKTHGLVLAQLLDRRQACRLGYGEWQKWVLSLAGDVQGRATRDQHLETPGTSEQIGDRLGGIDDPLEIIEDEQEPFAPEHATKALRQPTPRLSHAKHAGNR